MTLRLRLTFIVFIGLFLSVGRLPPTAAQDDALLSDRLGINHISAFDIPVSQARYDNALALGAGWNRWALYWNIVEPERNVFEWDIYDQLVARDFEHDLDINAILLGIPNIYRISDSIMGLNQPIFYDGTDIPAEGKFINPANPFASYVFRTVSRYMPHGELAKERGWLDGRGITAWEIWNEPDFSMFWRGGMAEYTRMLKVAYIIIHSLDPDATVMIGGLLYPTNRNWLQGVLQVIVNDPLKDEFNWFFDVVAIHSYNDAWRTRWLIQHLRRTMADVGIDRPFWITETGAAVWDDYPGPTWLSYAYQRTHWLSMEEQAAYFIQNTTWAFVDGVEKIFLFQLYDDCGNQPPGTNFMPHDGELCRAGEICTGDAFGVFTNEITSVCFANHPTPNSPRPIAAAYQLMAEVFAQPVSERGLIDLDSHDGVVSVTFYRPESNERVVIAWNMLEAEFTLPIAAEGGQAELLTLETRETIQPVNGEYAITLSPPRGRSYRQGMTWLPNGGMPVILIESISAAASITLQTSITEQIQAPFISATPTPLAQASLSEDELQTLVAQSPTGVVFTALQHARFRNLPSQEGTTVLGVLPPNNSASLVGRLADDSWYQLDYEGRLVWIAAFLGEVNGELEDVPVIDVTPTPSSGTEATTEAEIQEGQENP